MTSNYRLNNLLYPIFRLLFICIYLYILIYLKKINDKYRITIKIINMYNTKLGYYYNEFDYFDIFVLILLGYYKFIST